VDQVFLLYSNVNLEALMVMNLMTVTSMHFEPCPGRG